MPFRSSLFAFLTAFVAVLSLATAPSGMMPAWGNGGFSIKLCSPYPEATIAVAAGDPQYETLKQIEKARDTANGTSSETPQHDEAQMEQCSFAGFGGGAFILPDLAALPLPMGEQISSSAANLSLVIAHRLHLPPSTGPPSFS